MTPTDLSNRFPRCAQEKKFPDTDVSVPDFETQTGDHENCTRISAVPSHAKESVLSAQSCRTSFSSERDRDVLPEAYHQFVTTRPCWLPDLARGCERISINHENSPGRPCPGSLLARENNLGGSFLTRSAISHEAFPKRSCSETMVPRGCLGKAKLVDACWGSLERGHPTDAGALKIIYYNVNGFARCGRNSERVFWQCLKSATFLRPLKPSPSGLKRFLN